MAVGAQAFAVAFGIGSLALFHALEAAILALVKGEADIVLVAIADELTPVQQTAHALLGWQPTPGEFAGALALERGKHEGRRIGFVSYAEQTVAVSESWRQAPRLDLITPHPGPSMQNGETFRALSRGLIGTDPRIVVSATVPGLGVAAAGFETV
jgi:hypothetical protein